MKVDVALSDDLGATKNDAVAFEAAGYDGIWSSETSHDPFMQLVLASEMTSRVSVGTAIAVAFGRTPLTLAHSAYDLAGYSGGRFVLGLGSQVKPHIERRYSMPWSKPAARMREFVLALRAIWAAWESGEQLDFRGDFYTHTLMTPFFSPARHDFGPPPVYVAGVGERMTAIAGEVCDGFFVHALTTRRYFDEVTLPALRRGRVASGQGCIDDLTICGSSFLVVGRDEKEIAEAGRATKQRIAFYASTPSYRGVLELHGYGDLQPELTRLSKQGRWVEMGDVIDDDLLGLMAIVADPSSVAQALLDRWGDVYDRLSLYTPHGIEAATRAAIIASLRESP